MNLKWGAMVVVYSVSNRLSGNIDGRQQGLLLQATIGEADLRPPQSLTGGAMARALVTVAWRKGRGRVRRVVPRRQRKEGAWQGDGGGGFEVQHGTKPRQWFVREARRGVARRSPLV